MSIVNDEGNKVKMGTNPGNSGLGQVRFYCGTKSKMRGSDGTCGPNNGPQCNACTRFSAKLFNDEGCKIRLGTDPGRGGKGLVSWYCGRNMAIKGSDGTCGPNNGPQCPSCIRFTKDPAGHMAKLQKEQAMAQAQLAKNKAQQAANEQAQAAAMKASEQAKSAPAPQNAKPPIEKVNGWSSFISYKQVRTSGVDGWF